MQEYIVTTFGSDAAACAAMLLGRSPQAELLITSANRLAGTLERIHALEPGMVMLCGVGAGDNFAAVTEKLRKLKDNGFRVIWFCGRGYLDNIRAEISDIAECVFIPTESNCACIAGYCDINAGTPLHRQQLEIAADFCAPQDQRQITKKRQWWHDFIRACADDYFKFDTLESFKSCIRKLAGLLEVNERDENLVRLSRASALKAQPLGNSLAISKMRKMIGRVGPVDAPVLISGESGSGKELAARLLHESSPRAAAPFIAINCAVLSTNSDLAHDKLFGHIAGAYTGATSDSPGAFEAAEGGTLFLDEVAELPLSVQTQLLRALEEKEVTPLGSFKTKQINVRILAATNRPLQQMVEEGEFRLDLYHRLNVLRISVPSLTERDDDMRSIARSVLRELDNEGYPLKISEKDWKAAQSYQWPGNVRQFINLLKRSAYMKQSLGKSIREEAKLEGENQPTETWSIFTPATLKDVLPEAEIRKNYIRHVYELSGKSTGKTAKLLEITPNTLRIWLKD